MDAQINKIQNILENEYSSENFVTLTKEIFPEMQLVAPDKFNEEFSNFSSYVGGYTHIGNYTTPDNKKILILAIQLKNAQYVENSRSAQRNFAKRLIENNHCDASFIAFYTKPIAKRDEAETLNDKDSKWRISFVKIDYSVNFDNGKLKTNKNLTPAKRYSYLVGKGEPSHTAIERIKELIDKKNELTLDDVENAFSVEKVTDEFFKSYTDKFNDLNDYLKNNDDFKHEALRLGLKPEEFSVQFSKKLLGQIVFLYFLQKKGWLGVNAWPSAITEKEFKHAYYDFDKVLSREYIPRLYIKDPSEQDLYRLNTKEFKNISPNDESYLTKTVNGSAWGTGPRNFMRRYYDYAIKQENNNFYDDYLEPLFYDALNNNRGEEGYWSYFHCRIPFLSGSLFEPINNYDWQHSKFDIPNEMFSNKKSDTDINGNGILDIFDRYNFTMSEDEPMEKEVAIDPEMLGKVFENMLEVKDRKSKGAFYTPREIVHYMCQESLINYLTNNTGISQEAISDFILYGEYIKSEDTNRNNNSDLLISKEIYQEDSTGKIIVNRLKEIDDLLANIKVADPAVGSGAFPLGMLNEIVKARTTITDYMYKYENAYSKKLIYTNERSNHKLKVETIKNSIFAVDIEPSAVDIAKLRLWLALVIDDEINPNAQTELDGHKNPLPLPNLECNILCGNSLVEEFNNIKLIDYNTITGDNEEISFSAPTLKMLLNKLFIAEEKLFNCSNTDEKIALKKEIEDTKFEIIKLQIVCNGGASEEALNEIYKTRALNSKPFIIWQLDFARVFREKKGFDVVIGNPPYFNVQTFGYQNAMIDYLKKNYSEIWMDKSDILFYFIYLGYKISNSQVNYITSNAYLFSDKAKKFRNFIVKKSPIDKIVNFENYMVFDTASITSCITFFDKQKNTNDMSKAKVLSDSNIKLDEALYDNSLYFDIKFKEDSNFSLIKPEFLDLDKKIKGDYPTLGQLLKVGKGMETAANDVFLFQEKPEFNPKYLKYRISGEEINKYVLSEPNNYLLYYEDIESFDSLENNLKEYLLSNKETLEKRATVKNEGRPWWKYSRAMHKEYYKYNKIWCSYRASKNIFAYDDTNNYIGLTNTVAIFDTNPEISIKYILALVNSELLEYQHKNNSKMTGGNIYEYVPNTIEKYPIPKIPMNEQLKFINIVDKIIETKRTNINADVKEFENSLNEMVYNLYNINKEEITLIKNKLNNNAR